VRKRAKLQILRITREETAFRPVPLMPDLSSVSAAALATIPRARTSGLFGAFTLVGASPDQQWVVSACSILCAEDCKCGRSPLVAQCCWIAPVLAATHCWIGRRTEVQTYSEQLLTDSSRLQIDSK
jgi:hypothetical protein